MFTEPYREECVSSTCVWVYKRFTEGSHNVEDYKCTGGPSNSRTKV